MFSRKSRTTTRGLTPDLSVSGPSRFSLQTSVGKTIYVVTHPEAIHHVEKLVGGWYDTDLTVKGLADATRIAQWLRGQIPTGSTWTSFRRIYCVLDAPRSKSATHFGQR